MSLHDYYLMGRKGHDQGAGEYDGPFEHSINSPEFEAWQKGWRAAKEDWESRT